MVVDLFIKTLFLSCDMFDITYANQADNNCSVLQQSYNFESQKKSVIASFPDFKGKVQVAATGNATAIYPKLEAH